VAYFTVSISVLGPPPEKKEGQEDENALFRSILHSNRSACFARLKLWRAALADGEQAVKAKPKEYPKAYCRLGLAQLGCRLNEQAYRSFSLGLAEDEKCQTARRGRELCLSLIPNWDSEAATRRKAKFWRDANRPLGSTKVYAITDVHFDQLGKEEWAHSIHSTKFLEDSLIVTGNVADSFRAIGRALTVLRSKFRRVFYVPGNHEMWLNSTESKRFPDSFCKLWAIMDLCDELDVDMFPAAICKDVFVVPLLSWYNAAFDMKDPFPDPKAEHDKYSKWPIDQHGQVWRYMLRLNQESVNKPYHGMVITMSHFVPRQNLPMYRGEGALKAVGCTELDEQIRAAKSSFHFYGHTHYQNYSVHDGVWYAHQMSEWDGEIGREPILCVFNGEAVCKELVPI